MHLFKLFIAGCTPKNKNIIKTLKKALTTNCSDKFDLKIVDVFDNPAEAEDHKILATPTLLRQSPEPVKRLLGDLSNSKLVVRFLELGN